MTDTHYDVVIIGGGISGTALLFLLSRYTDLKKIALIEKLPEIAALNSHGRNNSQTLHCGDIETNYTLDKALQVKASAMMLVNYAQQFTDIDSLLFKFPKMVLGVGEQECQNLRNRFNEFSPHYPGMQLLHAADIEKIEPNVTRGRQEEIIALGILNEYTAVNFQRLAESFVDQAKTNSRPHSDILLNTRVKTIKKLNEHYEITTQEKTIKSRFVVVSSGAHSLLFAQKMGYGKEFACLPVAGSFYFTPKKLNGKVYTVQNDRLPFAAIHGDPDILVENKTRFGPTALILPVLERGNYTTMPDFFRSFSFDKGVFKTLGGLLKSSDVRNYIFKNMLFEIPGIRRRLFLKDAQKIIPELKLADISFASGFGGIRPVMIDKTQARLHLGEAKINPENGIIFNMTPSPGATSCLYNAERDLRSIVRQLACQFNEETLNNELHQETLNS